MTSETQDAAMYYSAEKNGFFPSSLKGLYGISWPDDAVPVTEEEHATFTGQHPDGKKLGFVDGHPAWVDNAEEAPTTWPPEAQANQMSGWVKQLLDTTAKDSGYDNMATAVGYVGDPNPVWAADAEALRAYRSAVWSAALPQINNVKAGTSVIPLRSLFIAMLPKYTRPA